MKGESATAALYLYVPPDGRGPTQPVRVTVYRDGVRSDTVTIPSALSVASKFEFNANGTLRLLQ